MAPANDGNGKTADKPAEKPPNNGPQATGTASQTNQSGPADVNEQKPDATKPSDPTPEKSAGAANPAQPGVDPQTGRSGGADAQGHASREAEEARKGGEPAANATLGATVNASSPGRPPTVGGGYSPAPAENTGDADSDRVPYTQAVQRLVHPEDMHDIPRALGVVANIPPGSRPMMMDTNTGLGIVPPQTIAAEEQEAEQARARKEGRAKVQEPASAE